VCLAEAHDAHSEAQSCQASQTLFRRPGHRGGEGSAGSACCLFVTTMLLSGGFLQWCLVPQQFDIVSVVVHVLLGASEEALSTRPLQNTAGRTKKHKKTGLGALAGSLTATGWLDMVGMGVSRLLAPSNRPQAAARALVIASYRQLSLVIGSPRPWFCGGCA
jgi:hypothetical protein